MSKKAKVGGHNKVVQKAAVRIFVIRPDQDGKFGAYCKDTGYLISLCDTAHKARMRAGKRGWRESLSL